MESTDEPRPGDDAFHGFQMSLPENSVEYMLFIVSDQAVAQRTTLMSLESVRKVALQRLDELTKDYIWQREGLKLETKIENGMSYPAITRVCIGRTSGHSLITLPVCSGNSC